MRHRPISGWFCLLALAAGLSSATLAQAGRVVRADQNLDGVADLWSYYGASGDLDTVLRDTNFDGYVDAREGFDENQLVSRQLDRNFDKRFDLSFGIEVPDDSDLTFNLAAKPYVLPKTLLVEETGHADRPAATIAPAAMGGTTSSASDRAPPTLPIAL